MEINYRKDIDALRAFAVVSVILFHLDYIKNGYLGVDVFFVISGYLITSIIYAEFKKDAFSLKNFYLRRIRRIIPLLFFILIVAYIFGILFMLPDDLENLCQSIVASSFSANNILMYITTKDYWAIRNAYKPLMHTWSLGIEEQFYLIYPLLFLFFKREYKKYILYAITFLTVISLFLFFKTLDPASKFYLLQYRFFELSLGGICAITFFEKNKINSLNYSNSIILIGLFALIILIFSNFYFSNNIKLILTVFLTSTILVLGNFQFETNKIYRTIMSNSILNWTGKISYSLYMWHQLIFAFARYFIFETITHINALFLILITIMLSIFTYFYIEQPFRNKNIYNSKKLITICITVFLIINSAAFYVYLKGGIIKPVPELGITNSDFPKQINFFSTKDNINIQYNGNVRRLDIPFSNESKKIKILVIGNSFGRDAVNILLESNFNNSIEVRYLEMLDLNLKNEISKRINDANFVFLASDYQLMKNYKELTSKFDAGKLYMIGTKDFGNSNGIHYNKKNIDYLNYRTPIKKEILIENKKYLKEWGDKYINLIGYVSDSSGNVLVFTPEGKFLSQDTQHLTKFGAKFYADLLNQKLKTLLGI